MVIFIYLFIYFIHNNKIKKKYIFICISFFLQSDNIFVIYVYLN